MAKYFCEWQVKDKSGTDCFVNHSRCLYNTQGIQYGYLLSKHKYGLYVSHTEDPVIGGCPDFNLREDLTEKIKNIAGSKKLKKLRELLK